MSDDDRLALRAIETRIDATLFGQRYWSPPKHPKWGGKIVNVLSYSAEAEPSDHVEITPAEAATYSWIFHHREYCSDWSLIDRLVTECEKRGWDFCAYHDLPSDEPWAVKLLFRNGPGEQWVRFRRGDSLPRALCRAIVAVLDATEGTVNEPKARDA